MAELNGKESLFKYITIYCSRAKQSAQSKLQKCMKKREKLFQNEQNTERLFETCINIEIYPDTSYAKQL